MPHERTAAPCTEEGFAALLGGHWTGIEGVFRLLQLTGLTRREAVVVTSGNDSFINQQPRRELLRLLKQVEASLRYKGRMG